MTEKNNVLRYREWWDPMVVFLVGAFTYVWHALWSLSCIHPSVWNEVAVAAGLYPPSHPFPGLYRLILAGMFKCLPVGVVLDLLPHIGALVTSASAMLVYLVFRDMLPSALRLKVHMSRIGARVGRLCAVVGALLFVCCDPVWRAGQTFTPVSLFLLLTVAAVFCFFRFLRLGSIPSLYACCAIVGCISAESVIGFVVAGLVMFGVLLAVSRAGNPDVPLVNPLVDMLVQVVVFKRLTYIWALSFLVAIGANVVCYISLGGLETVGHEGVLGLLFEYFKGGYEATCDASTGAGWLFVVVFALAPFFCAVKLLPRAWDEDKFLPWIVGVMYAVIGVVALTQLAGGRVLWFWTWLGGRRAMMPSDTLLSFVLLFDVAVVTFSLAVFGVDAICRNYRRIAKQQFPESMLEAVPAQMAESLGRARSLRKRFFWIAMAVIPLVTIPWRVLPAERAISKVIASSIDETLRETEGCEMIFTDGSFDPFLELEALRRGRSLYTLSLMSENTPHARRVRYRAAVDDEDRALLETDAASALRSWVAEKPERLNKSAVQIGFEMWRRAKKYMPPCSGLVALPGGVAHAERARALDACIAIGNDAYEIADEYDVEKLSDRMLRDKLSFVLWRLSRLAHIRSLSADEHGRQEEAITEAAKAEELNSVNSRFQKLRSDVDWIKRQNGGSLAPREGLVIGLARADFALAGRYAGPVLKADPDDPRANFAMGMHLYQEGQLSRAEKHLARCLIRRPDEPAALNNLAIVQVKLGKLDEAEAHVRHALEKYPNIGELKKTLESVQKARAEKK